MDAFSVQQHVADWLNEGRILGLDKAWPALPTVDGINWALFGSGEMRCQAVVYAETDTDVRRSGPGPNPYTSQVGSGVRFITFQIRVEFAHLSTDPDWIAADKALKQTIVEGAANMIKLDPTLGTSQLANPLFTYAGEGRTGLRRQYEPPMATDEGREQWAYLTFTAAAFTTG